MMTWTWTDCDCEDGYAQITAEDGSGEDILCPKCQGYTAYPRRADSLDTGDIFRTRADAWAFIERAF